MTETATQSETEERLTPREVDTLLRSPSVYEVDGLTIGKVHQGSSLSFGQVDFNGSKVSFIYLKASRPPSITLNISPRQGYSPAEVETELTRALRKLN